MTQAVSPQMSPEPGRLQPQHPDLRLDQVHLRQRQEVHRHRLRDLALRLGGGGTTAAPLWSPGLLHTRGPRHWAGLVLLWEADGRAAGPVQGTGGSWAGRRWPCPAWRQRGDGGSSLGTPRSHRVSCSPVAAEEQGEGRDLQWKAAHPSKINTDPGRRSVQFLRAGAAACRAACPLPHRQLPLPITSVPGTGQVLAQGGCWDPRVLPGPYPAHGV